MTPLRCLAAQLCLLALTACSSEAIFTPEVEAVLASSDTCELLALHPSPRTVEESEAAAEDDFHGYRVLARAPLEGRAQVNELIGLVERGIRASDGTVAACFNPRHGLRFTQDGDVVDFVICYECLSLHVHGPGDTRNQHLTVSTVRKPIDRIFGAVGLEIHSGD